MGIFGRVNEKGDIDLFHVDTGEPITMMEDCTIYPVGSGRSVCYEHPGGITLSLEDAESLGIEIENRTNPVERSKQRNGLNR